MKREVFAAPEMEVIMYTDDDVITSSVTDWDNQLPIVPVDDALE